VRRLTAQREEEEEEDEEGSLFFSGLLKNRKRTKSVSF
jgi:hypothetical protein